MMRKLYTLVFLVLTTLVYGQRSILQQNVNIRASELKHHLNQTEDSLILIGERTIYKVEIFNQDFEKTIIVKDSKIKIALNDIPVGRFVVEAVLPDKLIVITLLRNEIINNSPAITPRPTRKVSLFGNNTLASTDTKPSTEPFTSTPNIAIEDKKKEDVAVIRNKVVEKANKNLASTNTKASIVDIESSVIELKKPISKEHLASNQKLLENSAHKNVEAYWVVYQTNNRHSSGREMRFGDEKLVNKLIKHINLDKRTVAGKDNDLTVWEIYDVSAFLKYKMKNPNEFTEEADSFNIVPFFKSGRDLAKLKP